MAKKGDWSNHDNKRYTGKLDRIYVATTEYWEVEYFIDHYIESKGYVVNNKLRDQISELLEKYDGRAPVLRDELTKYLDKTSI